MKTLMIQGTSSGAGKSVFVASLCRIFSDKGYTVSPFKSQNMSNYAYVGKGFEISRAQAIQAVAARTKIIPELNPILLKPLGNYYSTVFVNGKRFRKMHATQYYSKFVNKEGIKIAKSALKKLQRNNDLVIIEGAGSPAEINLQNFDIANMKIAEQNNSPVVLITDIERGGSFASLVGTMSLLEKKYQKLVKGFIFNKFSGDVKILKPGFRKLVQQTKKQVYGVIPKIQVNLPEEDSLGVSAKPFSWNKKNLNKINDEIEKLSKLVKLNVNIQALEKLIK